MTFRTIGAFASSLTLLVAATAYSPQAQASPVQLVEYDLTITFIPGNPVFTDLTGAVAFTVPGVSLGDITPIQILKEFTIALIPGNPIFTGRFIPGNPISPVTFSFSGHSGNFNAFAFANDVILSALDPTIFEQLGPPIFPVPIFDQAGPPITPITVSGLIVGFDDPKVIGTWDITIQAATPLPGALAMFSGGLGVLGLLGWRRKRKAQATS